MKIDFVRAKNIERIIYVIVLYMLDQNHLVNRKVVITKPYWDSDNFVYYTLPLFTVKPKSNWHWPLFPAPENKDNLVLLILQRNPIYVSNGNGMTFRNVSNPIFTDEDVSRINETYFWMLDHPDITELEVHGINFIA